MVRVSEVDFAEVRETFLRDNIENADRNDWPIGALEVANRQFRRWMRVVLAPADLPIILLPYHFHERVALVPVAGSSVSEAIERLRSVDRASKCYRKIQQFEDYRTPMIYLSAAPINDPKYSDYHGLVSRGLKGLTHLDGLHRLVAWGQENRREVPAYVAGDLT